MDLYIYIYKYSQGLRPRCHWFISRFHSAVFQIKSNSVSLKSTKDPCAKRLLWRTSTEQHSPEAKIILLLWKDPVNSHPSHPMDSALRDTEPHRKHHKYEFTADVRGAQGPQPLQEYKSSFTHLQKKSPLLTPTQQLEPEMLCLRTQSKFRQNGTS